MPKETMTPRERWLAVLTRQTPDRVPMDYWGTPEATDKLIKHLGCTDFDAACERLHIDKVKTVFSRYAGPKIEDGHDMFGCRYQTYDYGNGAYAEVVSHPLAGFSSVEEIERNYAWPSADWLNYSGIADQLKGYEDYPIRGGGSEPMLTYKNLRGQEQAFMDLLVNPEIVHYCLGKLFELAYQDSLRIYEQIPGRVMITYVAEDLGGQENLMYSPGQIREYLLPGMKRMMELVHGAGAFVFHHSDGAVREIIPEMIDLGIDVLNPIQWRCQGMAREGLKRDFGGRLIFHGGVDNQYTLPFGTAEDVRREVTDNLKILGEGGGYILAPCHNIQAVSPPENVVALYEAGYEEGWR